MAGLETVYAIHNFEAENQDEIAFSVGEPIVVLEKDEGYNDGWWQGRNVRGEIGLFPMNYTSYQKPYKAPTSNNNLVQNKISAIEDAIAKVQLSPSSSTTADLLPSSQLPTPSTSTSTRRSRERRLGRVSSVSSLNSSQPSHSAPPFRSLTTNVTTNARNIQKNLTAALALPSLKDSDVEDWNVDQVAIWLHAMGFSTVADNFKAQEITGDILLELTLESLKELEVNTFGKRFKIHNAILALREYTFGDKENSTSEHRQRHYNNERQEDDHEDFSSSYSSPVSPRGGMPFSPTSATSKQETDYGSMTSLSSTTTSRTERLCSMDSAIESPTSIKETTKMSIGRKNLPRSASTIMAQHYSQSNNLLQEHERKRKTYTIPSKQELSMAQQVHTGKSQNDYMRDPSSPTSKAQNVLRVAHRASMDSIGNRSMTNVAPDMEGWLHKQGDKYKTWNKRWFVLKGVNLFYFKSPKDVRMKGIINLRGYRIICDETIYAGKFCFKAQHERERTFYFYTDSEEVLKAWTKAMMKATIARDFNAPVLSSSTIPTVSLDMARRMKPRPPSMILYKRETRPMSPPSLESIDEPRQPIARVPFDTPENSGDEPQVLVHNESLTSFNGSKGTITPLRTIDSHQELQDSGFDGAAPPHKVPSSVYEASLDNNSYFDYCDGDEDLIDPEHGNMLAINRPGGLQRLTEEEEDDDNGELLLPKWSSADYIDWINQCVDQKISDFSDLRSGEVLIQLLESLSGKEVPRPPVMSNASASMRMLDNIVAVFKFMGREGVEVDGRYTIKDVFGCNEPKIKEMLDAIRVWSNARMKFKKASGGTFGEFEQEQLKALRSL